MKALSDPDKRAGWILHEGTLRWPSLIATIELTSGAKWSAPLDIDPIVLYNASEPDESRPSAPPIGALLRTARKQAGLTQEELAYRSGTTKNHISRIENDRSDIELGTLAKIVEVGLGKKLDIRFLG
jgi:DNA-binding XRE family transcriptional regulator